MRGLICEGTTEDSVDCQMTFDLSATSRHDRFASRSALPVSAAVTTVSRQVLHAHAADSRP